MNRELIGFEIRSSDDMATNYKVYKMEYSFKCAEDKHGNSMGNGILKANGKI